MKAFIKRATSSIIAVLSTMVMSVIGLLGRWHRALRLFRFRQLEFVSRPSDIFVASYPRSGTTWLQMIVYQLFSGGDREFIHISQVVPFFERLGIQPGHDVDPVALTSRRLFKTHLRYDELPKGDRKYIYVARNGEDVAVSYFNFYRSHLGFRGTFDDFFPLFMAGRVQYGSWFDHVASWRRHKNAPNVLFLDYEELVADPAAAIRQVAEFCEIEIDPEKFPRILEACSFPFMKQHEQKFDHVWEVVHELRVQMNTFIREGRVGQGKTAFTTAQRARFNSRSVA